VGRGRCTPCLHIDMDAHGGAIRHEPNPHGCDSGRAISWSRCGSSAALARATAASDTTAWAAAAASVGDVADARRLPPATTAAKIRRMMNPSRFSSTLTIQLQRQQEEKALTNVGKSKI